MAAIPRTVRFVAKDELFRLAGLRLVPDARRPRPRRSPDHARAVASLAEAAARVRAGTCLIVFPEGTRSRDGLVHAFKKGPFVIAAQAGVPVVPIAITGRREGHPEGPARTSTRGRSASPSGRRSPPREFPGRDALLREVAGARSSRWTGRPAVPAAPTSRPSPHAASRETLATSRTDGKLPPWANDRQGVPGLVEGALDQGRRAASGLAEGFRKAGRWQKARLSLVGRLDRRVAPRPLDRLPLVRAPELDRRRRPGAQGLAPRGASRSWFATSRTRSGPTWCSRSTAPGEIEQRALRPREQVVLSPAQFERGGEPAPRDLRPGAARRRVPAGQAGFELR